MFVQVIQGSPADAAELRGAVDRWVRELGRDAPGWLGSTAGVTDDGRFIALVRFESEDAARRNSERPEQDQWWTETSKLFSGPVAFHDSTDVTPYLRGGSDDAGFVQVIQGRVADPERVKSLFGELAESLPTGRPEIIGGLLALHDGDRFTQTAYFTSEAEAREGEAKEPPAEVRPRLDELMSLMPDRSFFDLRDPWLVSPG